MSAWKELRKDVVIADLATTDIAMESLQSEGPGMTWKSPHENHIAGIGPCQEWAFKVYAYDDNGVNRPGTLTAQVIERSDVPGDSNTSEYTGFAPVADLPTGRIFTVPGATFHEFTVRCSSVSAVSATKLRILYRPLR